MEDGYSSVVLPRLATLSVPVVVLIGANVDWGHEFLHHAGVQVYCIEPQPSCLVTLREAAARDVRIHVLPYAVGDVDGRATFLANAWNETSSIRQPTARCHGIGVPREMRPISVTMRRLDTLIAAGELPAFADFISLDVQGFELEVIKGGRDFFARSKMVLCEVTYEEPYEGQALYEAVRDELVGLGYIGDREVTDEERRRTTWSNILFTRSIVEI